MNQPRRRFVKKLCAGALGLPFLSGCGKEASIPKSIRVGIIAGFTGPAQEWATSTLDCAQVIADYHNERGGFLVGQERFPVELVVGDGRSDPDHAATVASDLVTQEGVRFFVGPLADDGVAAVAPVFDAHGVVYVHYGFDGSMLREESLGILGMPAPDQTLPALFQSIKASNASRLCVVPRISPSSFRQKGIAEKMAEEAGFEVLNVARYDVLEQAFDISRGPERINQWAERAVAERAEAVLFVGLRPVDLPVALVCLNEVGFDGIVATQNAQAVDQFGPELLGGRKMLFVGGSLPDEERSPYFLDLKDRLKRRSEKWSVEYETKLYALETLLQGIRLAGPEALSSPERFLPIFNTMKVKDPFFAKARDLEFRGLRSFGVRRQINTPVILSMVDASGQHVIYKGELEG